MPAQAETEAGQRHEQKGTETRINVARLNTDTRSAAISLLQSGFIHLLPNASSFWSESDNTTSSATIGLSIDGTTSTASIQFRLNHSSADLARKMPTQSMENEQQLEKDSIALRIQIVEQGQSISMNWSGHNPDRFTKNTLTLKINDESDTQNPPAEYKYEVDVDGNVESLLRYEDLLDYPELLTKDEKAITEIKAKKYPLNPDGTINYRNPYRNNDGRPIISNDELAAMLRDEGVKWQERHAQYFESHADDLARIKAKAMEVFNQTFPRVLDGLGIIKQKTKDARVKIDRVRKDAQAKIADVRQELQESITSNSGT